MQNIFREFVFILFYRSRLIVMVFLTVFIVSLGLAVALPGVAGWVMSGQTPFSVT